MQDLTCSQQYKVVYKIFETDALKIVKLTIRSVGHRYPQSSSLARVDTGPPLFERFLEVLFYQYQALSAIWPVSPQWYQTGVLSASISCLEIGRSHRVPNQGSMVGEGDSSFVLRQELLGEDRSVIRGVVMVKQPGLFLQKFGATSSHILTHSLQNVAVEPGIHSSA